MRHLWQVTRENSENSVKNGSKSDWKKFRAEHQERVTSCMCLCRTKVSHPVPPTLLPSHLLPTFPSPPPHPIKNHTCNVTTSSKCAIFDKLQEKIRSITPRPAQKVTGKSSERSIKSVSQAACAYVCRTKVSHPVPPTLLPPHVGHSWTMLWNVSRILQRAKHLASCQLSCNVTTSSKCAICVWRATWLSWLSDSRPTDSCHPGWLTRAFRLADSRLPVGWLAPSCWLTRAFLLADSGCLTRSPVGWHGLRPGQKETVCLTTLQQLRRQVKIHCQRMRDGAQKQLSRG